MHDLKQATHALCPDEMKVNKNRKLSFPLPVLGLVKLKPLLFVKVRVTKN